MNDKVKNIMKYTAIFGSIISAIAYLMITYVIVVGFESAVDQQKQILFAILGSSIGLIITFLLRTQGITFAQKEDESVKTMQEYHELLNEKKSIKEMHLIGHFMKIQTIKDIFSKGISIAGSTFLIMYIFMEGNGDFSLFVLAGSNIMMFTGFGLIALSKAYDKYIDEHIPVIKAIIKKLKEKEDFKHSNIFMELFENSFKLLDAYELIYADTFIDSLKYNINQIGLIRSEEKQNEHI